MKHVGTAAPHRQRVLVTGFGAFPGAPRNPTLAVLTRLSRHRARLERLGVTLDCTLIPVTFSGIAASLDQAVGRKPPDAILHLGLASRRRRLCVETRALNRAGPLHPGADKRVPPSQILVRHGVPVVKATYAAASILTAIRRTGLPAIASIDAGDYVCNATLYRSLAARMAPQIGFLHVPRIWEKPQPTARTKRPRPTIAALTEAVLAALLVMARAPGGRMAPPEPTGPPTDGAPEDR
jgi:pyroglutamyl-peptidase